MAWRATVRFDTATPNADNETVSGIAGWNLVPLGLNQSPRKDERKFSGALDDRAAFERLFFCLKNPVMPLHPQFYPKRGHVLLCDFSRGFVAPEMLKRRPVVVISPSATHGRKLCTVIPLSTTAPDPVMPWHYPLQRNPNPLETQPVQVWAKCDMLYTVAFERLDKFHRKTRNGREYLSPSMSAEDFAGVLTGVRAYLSFV
ncbi:uncharacterized protein YifN (PemK superfamily) [Crenobacter luteus]|uniref:type II toxin-antitoxin system PemK/MazF family toxin n=1 Tax=Crenobacter luteus TaxID=1452487 RepID=UPI0010D718FA|nr:type II toxin-antitoxin system PemK/MazF family toxin [Crenobacter luteus]TCP10894.1 uncharacterized protein YifN (PemK superfamily) [Crenobacter luteus]